MVRRYGRRGRGATSARLLGQRLSRIVDTGKHSEFARVHAHIGVYLSCLHMQTTGVLFEFLGGFQPLQSG
jgi:hypothetical protein